MGAVAAGEFPYTFDAFVAAFGVVAGGEDVGQIVVYAARTAHLSAGEIGLVFAGFGVGGVVAAASLSRTMKMGVGRLLTIGYVVGARAIAALPFVGGDPVTRTGCLAGLFFVAGCAIVSANIVEMTMRQAATPNAVQGRVAAGFGFLIGALTPIAALTAGVLRDQIGPRATLIVAAVGVPASLPWILFSRVRRGDVGEQSGSGPARGRDRDDRSEVRRTADHPPGRSSWHGGACRAPAVVRCAGRKWTAARRPCHLRVGRA